MAARFSRNRTTPTFWDVRQGQRRAATDKVECVRTCYSNSRRSDSTMPTRYTTSFQFDHSRNRACPGTPDNPSFLQRRRTPYRIRQNKSSGYWMQSKSSSFAFGISPSVSDEFSNIAAAYAYLTNAGFISRGSLGKRREQHST